MYLARLLEKASDEETRENLLRAAAVHTPIAWGHINFAEEKLKDALGILPLEIYYLKLPRFQCEARHPALIAVRA